MNVYVGAASFLSEPLLLWTHWLSCGSDDAPGFLVNQSAARAVQLETGILRGSQKPALVEGTHLPDTDGCEKDHSSLS